MAFRALRHHAKYLSDIAVNDDLALLYLRHAANLRTPLHAHDRACFSIVVDGGFDEYFGRQALDCHAGTVLFRPAGEAHHDSFGSSGSRELVFEVAPGWLERVRSAKPVLGRPAKHDTGGVGHIESNVLWQLHNVDETSPLAIEGLALLLAARFIRDLPPETGPRPPRWLRVARDLIDDSDDERITLAEISDAVNVHPVHLSRQFRRYFGASIPAYVRSRRIERVQKALCESDAPLARLAQEAGFAHQSHLTRVFKSVTGMTPAAYRRIQRSG